MALLSGLSLKQNKIRQLFQGTYQGSPQTLTLEDSLSQIKCRNMFVGLVLVGLLDQSPHSGI